MKKKVLLGSAAVVGLTFICAAPAQAYAVEQGKLNLYQHKNYGGCHEARVSYDQNFKNDACIGPNTVTFNDVTTSFINTTDNWWVMYENSDYQPAWICVRPHSRDADISNDTKYNDKISSVSKYGDTKPMSCTDTTGTPY